MVWWWLAPNYCVEIAPVDKIMIGTIVSIVMRTCPQIILQKLGLKHHSRCPNIFQNDNVLKNFTQNVHRFIWKHSLKKYLDGLFPILILVENAWWLLDSERCFGKKYNKNKF